VKCVPAAFFTPAPGLTGWLAPGATLAPWRTSAIQALGLAITLWLSIPWASRAAGDEFILKNGGRVEGELLNPDQSPRENYVVRLADDQQVTLDAKQVRQVRPKSESLRAYEQWLPKMPQSADGNWKMADWCGRHKLREQEQFHLAEAIRLNPDHESARRRLGYIRLEGRWIKPEEHQREQGYQLHGGRYRASQDIEAIERREEQERAEKELAVAIRRLRDDLRGGRSPEDVRHQLMEFRQPLAVPALSEALAEEKDRSLRAICIDVLGQIEGPAATAALVQGALNDPDQETRLQCVDQLEHRQDPRAADAMVQALESRNSRRINRAAVALRRLGDRGAIPYLIDVLRTKHVQQIQSNPGQIGASFPRDGTGGMGGLTLGSQTIRREVVQENRSVLDALIALSGGANFLYDQARWRQWYAETNTVAEANLRRTE
jgi:hypothetical protein